MSTAVIKLAKLECVKQQEENGDEIYIEFTVDYEGEKSFRDRLPMDKSKTFFMKRGDVRNTVDDLYASLISSTLTFTFNLMEQDAVGRLSQRNLLDDNIGEFKMIVTKDDQVTWEVGKNTKYKASDIPHHHNFVMTGSGAEYIVDIYFRLI